MKKYNSVIDMIKSLGKKSFYTQFLLFNIQDIFKKYQHDSFRKHACYKYQCFFKIFLDEYPEQELLRKGWFQKRDNEYFIDDVISWGKEESKTINTNETYWINRWEKTN